MKDYYVVIFKAESTENGLDYKYFESVEDAAEFYSKVEHLDVVGAQQPFDAEDYFNLYANKQKPKIATIEALSLSKCWIASHIYGDTRTYCPLPFDEWLTRQPSYDLANRTHITLYSECLTKGEIECVVSDYR